MKKAQTLTTTAALILGAAGGSFLGDINAKDVDQRVNVQMVLPAHEAKVILGVITRQACPKVAASHGASCDLDQSFLESRFDVFKDGGGKSMRMHARFKFPGKFKAD